MSILTEAIITILNLILLAIVVFIFWRLHSVLGLGGDRTQRPKGGAKSKKASKSKIASKRPNLRLVSKQTKPAQANREAVKSPAPANLPAHVRKGLEAISAKDRQFSIGSFLKGATQAYEIILLAYASHDRARLKPLLSQEVFDGFDKPMRAREAAGHKLATNIIKLAAPTIHDAELDGRFARITAQIEAELSSILCDADGKPLADSPQSSEKTTDLWTFERAIDSNSPNWLLIATETI